MQKTIKYKNLKLYIYIKFLIIKKQENIPDQQLMQVSLGQNMQLDAVHELHYQVIELK